MPFVSGHTKSETIRAMEVAIERHCATAFAADCRVAIRWNANTPGAPLRVEYQFIVLSPGDPMPTGRGWEIWENHSGMAVGRAI